MRLIVTGGGTGGHLFPALAVARGVEKRLPGSRVLFIGTDREVDNQALAGQGFERAVLRCSGIKGLGWQARVRALLALFPAVARARRLIRDFGGELVFSVGGYVTGPVVLAAASLRIPVCLHEQNSVPGLANRLAGRLADRVCLSMECSPPFDQAKTVMTGNPVREEILAAAHRKAAGDSAGDTLLVLGGSQGAHRINRLLAGAADRLAAAGIRVIHQTGTRDRDMVARAYEAAGVEAEVRPFFRDMARLYGEAALAVSRAGATTLAELAVMGVPALLIPYPHAADDHQTVNGRRYAEPGGAVLLAEQDLESGPLADRILALLADRQRLAAMAGVMRSLAHPGATDRIVDVCLDLAGEQGK